MWRSHIVGLFTPLRVQRRCCSASARAVGQALQLASANGATKNDVEQLHSVLDKSRRSLSFEETVGILGPLGQVSKIHGPPPASIVIPMYDQIGDGLTNNASFLTQQEAENLRTVCRSLVDLRTFHAPILGEMVHFLESHLLQHPGSDNVLCEFDVAADCLYAISFLRKAAPSLFRSLLVELGDRNYVAYHSLDAASKINWAYLAQGVERPKSMLKVFMRRMFEYAKGKSLPFECISEFSQVVESFNDQMGYEDVYKLVMQTYVAKSPDVQLINKLGPLDKSQLIVKNVSSLKGFLPICALIDKAQPGRLVRFPRNRVPEHMTSRLPESLGVYATTVVFLQDDQVLEPIGEVTGVVKRRLSLMKTSGWHYQMVKLSDVQHLEGEALDEFIVASMEEAVAERRAQDAATAAAAQV